MSSSSAAVDPEDDALAGAGSCCCVVTGRNAVAVTPGRIGRRCLISLPGGALASTSGVAESLLSSGAAALRDPPWSMWVRP
nr:hypothetical protein [uncultured Rhodopila sp.]